MVRSSATRRAPSSIRRRARSDLPAPLLPSSRTPQAPSATQLAWMLTSAMNAQRQFHDQPRAGSLLPLRIAVLRIDAPARALDDLARDGKAQARIPAEILAGPLGIETLEDGLHILRRNAWAFVLHRHPRDHVILDRRDDDLAGLGTEGGSIVDQVAENLAQPLVAAAHHHAGRQL